VKNNPFPLLGSPGLAGLLLLSASLLLGTLGNACTTQTSSEESNSKIRVITTVSPIRNIVENVGGDRVSVTAVVPEGTNSHTFEPAPSLVREIVRADLIFANGLNLELPLIELVEANLQDGVEFILLGEATITPDEYVYDFSFPKDGGDPNPHLWTDPMLAGAYAEHVREALSRLDPDRAAYYEANTIAFLARLEQLDAAIRTAVATVPQAQRVLLTYHDSFPYFGPRYGLTIIGAIQPSDFSEPSPREVADLIEQIRRAKVPAIFGSEVFPSEVLKTIADEVGAVQVATLRDDDLPGDTGDIENTYLGMMVENVRTIVESLGGDASALDGFDISFSWIPFKEHTDG
tara:strand:- start:4538 stop:5578 length:1041 start_codon:yes stop_codon:yes gene_type:complete